MQDGQIKKKKNQLSWDVINWVDNNKLLCYTLPQRSTPVKEP